MSTRPIPPDEREIRENRIDDRDAALEESEEQNEENQVAEEAEANQKEPSTD
jgi:hypothetical protein